MLTHVFIALALSNTAFCQLNGEFWWLNKDFAAIHNIEPPQPIFEDISELETDESVKVVFKENELTFDKRPSDKENEDKFLVQNKILPYIVFIDDLTKLTKRDLIKNDSINTNSNINSIEDEVKNSTNTVSWKETYKNKDELKFTFPDDWEVTIKNLTHKNGTKDTNITNGNNEKQRNPKIVLNDKIWFEEERKDTETESICSFVSRHECFLQKGFVHMPQSCPKNIPSDACKICCVLPLTSSKSQKPYLLYKRQKRSDPEQILSTALKQRNALLLREYNSNAQQPKLVTTTLRTNPLHKIVTPEDSVDPYWNIKSQKFRRPNQNQPNFKDYDEDYAAEIPKPGLVGLYSDREDQVMTWKLKTDKGWHGSYGGIDEDSYEDDTGDGFGYSTVDPRFGTRKTTASYQRRRPQRLMTPSTVEDATRTSESQSVHFHSTPDFRVLEGFKLVNLAENKNKYIKRATSENFYPSEEDLSIENTSPFYIPNSDVNYSDAFDINIQVFKNCGREKVPASDTSSGKGTEGRCDPWLVVVVLTKNPENILCYATIVHPRAAVTAASCVHGKATGEISAIAGVWDLKDRSQSQHRMASILVRPQFNADDLANDLALLHWKRPLMLQPNVSPACLADPHVGDECYFVGWGGYDQALKRRPQWQHATILTPRSCNDKISSPEVDIPADAFCTAVDTRGTVTGVGGPLLCRAGDRVSVVGVAVYRENVVVLLPALEWVTSGLRELQIN